MADAIALIGSAITGALLGSFLTHKYSWHSEKKKQFNAVAEPVHLKTSEHLKRLDRHEGNDNVPFGFNYPTDEELSRMKIRSFWPRKKNIAKAICDFAHATSNENSISDNEGKTWIKDTSKLKGSLQRLYKLSKPM